MYSDDDLDRAVGAGILTPDAAAAFRRFATGDAVAPVADEERFRLITGFNDIFVSIAAALLLGAVGWLVGDLVGVWAGAAAAAGTAWALAEHFTRVRRMALPSILLLVVFVGGVLVAALYGFGALLGLATPERLRDAEGVGTAVVAGAGAITAGLTFAHWRRFRVPITVAAGVAVALGTAVALLFAAVPGVGRFTLPLVFAAGLVAFALAMRWDMSDRERLTRRSDVAFWLHLLAAPLIVHPVFAGLGVLDASAGAGAAALVVGLYVALALVALAVDRRALMVSALAYVLSALATLFREFGTVGLNLAITALVVGSALLLLSAYWHAARTVVVGLLPAALRDRLPPARGSGGAALAA